MKKTILVLAMSAFICACGSPPEPTPFPSDSKETNANTFLNRDVGNNVPLNRLNEKTWTYALVNHGNIIHQAEFAKFWYLAHHATHIEVSGEENDIQILKQRLIANGVTAEFNLIPNFHRTIANECQKIVNIVFSKKQSTKDKEIL